MRALLPVSGSRKSLDTADKLPYATLPPPVVGGGSGGNGLPGVSSAATLPPPVVGGGSGGNGLPGVSSAATLPPPVVGGGSGGNGLPGVAKAEETMVAARKVPKITVQIFGQIDFMGESSFKL